MAQQKVGQNQSVARKMNNVLAIKEFLKRPISGTELSANLHLSNATSSSIIKSLLKKGIIREDSSDSVSGIGRKRKKYVINERFGLILVISLSSYSLRVVLADIRGNNFYQSESEIEVYDFLTLKKAIDGTCEILKGSQFNGLSLKCVIISLPGLINKKTGKLQMGPQFNPDLFSNSDELITYPQKMFHCPVFLENDTKLMMSAELSSGEFEGVKSGMLAYIDYGVGGAFEFNDKLYLGSRGYSGEIGKVKVESKGEYHHLDNSASIRVMKEKLLAKRGRKYKTAEIIDLFHQKDPFVRDLALGSAAAVGNVIKEIISVFDIEQFTILGRVKEFGEEYLDEVKKYAFKENPEAIVHFSKFSHSSAIIEGAKASAASFVIEDALANI